MLWITLAVLLVLILVGLAYGFGSWRWRVADRACDQKPVRASLKVAASQAAQEMIDGLQQSLRVPLHPFHGVTLHRGKAHVAIAL